MLAFLRYNRVFPMQTRMLPPTKQPEPAKGTPFIPVYKVAYAAFVFPFANVAKSQAY